MLGTGDAGHQLGTGLKGRATWQRPAPPSMPGVGRGGGVERWDGETSQDHSSHEEGNLAHKRPQNIQDDIYDAYDWV